MTGLTFGGVVRDGFTNETLPGAHVYAERNGAVRAGVVTGADGTYIADGVFEPGELLTVSFVGYRSINTRAPLASTAEPLMHPLQAGVALNEFEVVAERGPNWGALLALLAGVGFSLRQ